MADDHDVFIGIKLLVSAAGDVAHGNVFASRDTRDLELPRFANVQERKSIGGLGLHFFGRDFVIHKSSCFILVPEICLRCIGVLLHFQVFDSGLSKSSQIGGSIFHAINPLLEPNV
ncbi:MAG: hypothetical protein JWO91_3560 [Acidobacteriaceae bacterium]|nr:hypothetical protein [Acidobacteriaceae bacterium]